VRFTTGTDEHGLKVLEAARDTPGAHNGDPKQFCDAVSSSFARAFDAAGIAPDRFVRTTDADHAVAVDAMWRRMLKSGDLYKGTHEGWYCASDEVFVPENMVEPAIPAAPAAGGEGEGDNVGDKDVGDRQMVSSESGRVLRWVSEENWKFRLSAYEDRLLAWLDGDMEAGHDSKSHSTTTDGGPPVRPPKRLNEVRQLIKGGLRDISVSRLRSKVPWALPVPDDDAHSIYVWVDALTNYLTVTGFGTQWGRVGCEQQKNGDGDNAASSASSASSSDSLSKFWPAHCHIIGKDILRFHCVYWPAFLMAAGLPLPRQVVAHGHWTTERVKMSKSLGNVVAPDTLIEEWGVDPVRYFFLREANLSTDADFSAESIEARVNSELADTLGNLATRCTGSALLPEARVPFLPDAAYSAYMATLHPDKAAPRNDRFLENVDPDHVKMIDMVMQLRSKVADRYDEMEFDAGLSEIMAVLRETNAYFQRHEPWALRKRVREGSATAEDEEELDMVLYTVLESLRVAGILLQPVIPGSAERLLDHLGVPNEAKEEEGGGDEVVVEEGQEGEEEKGGTGFRSLQAALFRWKGGGTRIGGGGSEKFVLYAKRKK
jgi:methionyl-tRNA synthetase